VPVVSYTTQQWEWDEAKFQMKAPLRELSEGISMRISALDDELKIKVTELNTLKGSLQGIERKTLGNLMVRGLSDIIDAHDVVESEYMTTVVVVVPKGSMKEFEGTFHKMAAYVVPRSAKLISEDIEYGLYTCVLFKKSLDEFKASAREKRHTIRDFTYDANALENDRNKKAADTREYDRLKGMLSNWCQVNYAEVFTMMIHLKAVRIFVESVLRFGLTTSYMSGMTPNFKAFLLQPKKGKSEALRKALGALIGGSAVMAGEGEEEMVVPGAQGEFYPYVYTAIETEPNVS
jgi:V-type H+-transporting ATPase subunit C